MRKFMMKLLAAARPTVPCGHHGAWFVGHSFALHSTALCIYRRRLRLLAGPAPVFDSHQALY